MIALHQLCITTVLILSRSLYQNEGLVLWLLSQGASASAACDWDEVPIERAAQYAPLSMLKLLVAHGARVQSTDAVVKAAIGDAMGESGRLEVVKYLAGLEAPINAHDMHFCDHEEGTRWISLILLKGRMTALHHAAKAGKRGMTALLLELGAEKSLRNFAEKTALDLAVEQGHHDIIFMLQN
jgi:ankyrin repeat protein